MYTVTRGPSKLASKANRRGPVQIEKLDPREHSGRPREPLGQPTTMSFPKPIFNGKKTNYNRSNSNSGMAQEPVITTQEESIKYVADVWQRIQNKYETSLRNGSEGGPVVYQDKKPGHIEGFEPFDLEQWWGNRTLQKIEQSS